jgi:hypothetical protein
MPISTLPVQNEDCSSTTRGGRPRMFDMKEEFTRPSTSQVSPLNTHHPRPPIRDCVPYIPKLISYNTTPLSPPGPPRPFLFLGQQKNGENRGKEALSEHFDNKPSIWPAAPTVQVSGFFLMANGRIPPSYRQYAPKAGFVEIELWPRRS